MAIQGQVRLLLSGSQVWNSWREKYHRVIVNLENADLESADLSGVNLTRANLKNANLKNTNLTGANLIGANLTGANLENANLTKANLTRVKLKNSELTDANLFNANLTRADLTGAKLIRTDLVKVNFKKTQLQGVEMEDVDLEDAINLGYSNYRNNQGKASFNQHLIEKIDNFFLKRSRIRYLVANRPLVLAFLILIMTILIFGWTVIPTLLADWVHPIFENRIFSILIIFIAGLFFTFYLGSYREDWSGLKNKKLWDWLDLLLIPVFLAIGTIYIEVTAESRQEELTQRQKAKEAVLKYYETMTRVLDGIAEINGQLEVIKTSSEAESETKGNNQQLQNKEERLKVELEAKKDIAKSLTVATISILKESEETGKQEVQEIFKFLRESELLPKEKQDNEKGKGKIDFRDADLSELDLSNSNLNYVDFTDADLTGVIFKEADLRGANLKGAYLENADFSEANLEDAQWGFAQKKRGNGDEMLVKIKDDKFKKTKLRGMTVLEKKDKLPLPFGKKTKLTWQILNDKESLQVEELKNKDLSGAYLRFADLSDLDLSTIQLKDTNLKDTILIATNLEQTCSIWSIWNWNCDLSKKDNLEAAYLAMTKINPDHFSGDNYKYLLIWKIVNHDLIALNKYLLEKCTVETSNVPKYCQSQKLKAIFKKCSDLTQVQACRQEDLIKKIEQIKSKIDNNNALQIINSNFNNQTIEKVDLAFAILNGANLERFTLDNVQLNDSFLEQTNLTNTTLKDVNFDSSDIVSTLFKGATLQDVSFKYANLENVSFDNANLENVSFDNANLENVFFKNITFRKDIDQEISLDSIKKMLSPNCKFGGQETYQEIDILIDGKLIKKKQITIPNIDCANE